MAPAATQTALLRERVNLFVCTRVILQKIEKNLTRFPTLLTELEKFPLEVASTALTSSSCDREL